MLAAAGVGSAPTAASVVWAGAVAIAALVLWSGLQPETPPRGFSQGIADVLRIPDSIHAYLTFAAVVPAAIAAAAGWRLMRRRGGQIRRVRSRRFT
jgi:hypothetical protein